MKAISAPSLPNQLVRAVFEIKAVVVNGEFPGIPAGRTYLPSTEYAVEYITASTIEKLYTFNVVDEVLWELKQIAGKTCKMCLNTKFKSLEILDTLD